MKKLLLFLNLISVLLMTSWIWCAFSGGMDLGPICIIGGADGPTSIFVEDGHGLLAWIPFVLVLFILVGSSWGLWRCSRRRRQVQAT